MKSFICIFVFLSLLELAPAILASKVNRKVCQKRNGLFAKPGSLCRSYYRCKNWIPKEETCPGNDHFFPARGRCEYPEVYPCLEKPNRKECPRSNGNFLKNGTNCKVYYQCCNGIPTEKLCGGDLLFNPSSERCEWPELYKCIEKPNRKECLRPDGKFLKPGTSCKVYYQCHNGIPTEKRCSGNLLFNPAAETCDWPELYTCVEEPDRKECLRPNGNFLKPGSSCKVYYQCHNGIPTEKRCSGNLLFNPAAEACDWPELYTCVEDVSTTSSILVPLTTTPIHTTKTSTATVPELKTESQPTSETTVKFTTRTEKTKTFSKSLTMVSRAVTDKTTSTTDQRSTTRTNDIFTGKTTSSPEATKEQWSITPTSEVTVQKTTTSTTDQLSTTRTKDISTGTTSSSPEATKEQWSTTPTVEVTVQKTTSTTDKSSTTRTNDISTEKTSSPEATKEQWSMTPTAEVTVQKTTTSRTDQSSTTETNDILIEKTSASSEASKEQWSITPTVEVTVQKTEIPLKTTEPKQTVSTGIVISSTRQLDESEFECEERNGYFPHPYDKHKFIACVEYRLSIFTCPSNLVYNHSKRRCDYS